MKDLQILKNLEEAVNKDDGELAAWSKNLFQEGNIQRYNFDQEMLAKPGMMIEKMIAFAGIKNVLRIPNRLDLAQQIVIFCTDHRLDKLGPESAITMFAAE